MDNLGFQGIYGLIKSDPRVHCERVFFDNEPGRGSSKHDVHTSRHRVYSFESKLPLKSFDVVAFSISFENDYINVLKILKAAGIEPFASKRDERSPLLLAGGVATCINPEPISPFFDAVFLGEADEAVQEMLDVLVQMRTRGKRWVVESLASVGGMYVPSIHSPFLRERGTAIPPKGVARRSVIDLSSNFRSSVVPISASHLGGMFLVEASRGCSRQCRFCAVASVYAPLRFVSPEPLLQRIEKGAPARGAVGIVGACLSDYPKLSEVVRALVRKGLRVSLSSIRADTASTELLSLIAESGTKTITTAPEAGTARLRQTLNKQLDEKKLTELAEAAREGGIVSLKLYFMIGLPGEKPEDIEAIISLVSTLRSKFLSGKKTRQVAVSVSPFVPKAFTPLQWCRMLDRDSLLRRMEILTKGFSRMAGVKFSAQSVRGSILEAALSRSDWRAAQALFHVVYDNLSPKQAWTKAGLRLEIEVSEPRDTMAPLPWDHLLIGPKREDLLRELNQALQESQ